MKVFALMVVALGFVFVSCQPKPPGSPVSAQATPVKSVPLVFKSYNGNPAKPALMDFQIDTLNIRQPSSFLKIGDKIPKTNFTITKFQFIEKIAQNRPALIDASELTITDTVTGETFILVLPDWNDSTTIP